MKIFENSGNFFTEQDVVDILAAANKIETAMGLADGTTGKLKLALILDGAAAPVTLLSLTLPAGEGGNCANEKIKALFDNPTADFTTDCVYQVGDRTVSWQGGLRVKFDGGDLLIAFSGLEGWQDLFFAFGTAAVLSQKENFGGWHVLSLEKLEATLAKNKENNAIYHLVKTILGQEF